nr:hypothetical protein [Tanacetum cinerariifolium]
MPFKEIEAKFVEVWKQVKDFIPMGSKEETKRLKQKGLNLEKEQVKKQKSSEEALEIKTSTEEFSEEKMKEMMQRSIKFRGRLLGIKCTRHSHCQVKCFHWQYKFPLPVKIVTTARREEMPLPEVCTAIEEKKKKLPVNDVMRLQALVDRKKVIITEATIQEALRLDDVEGIDCLPNEEIFTELSRMGGHHEMSSVLLWLQLSSAFNREQVGDLSSHTTKYSSHALTQKVFANIRRVGKGFSRVETHLFEGMIVVPQADDVADEGATGVDADVVPAAAESSIPSRTPTTQPPSQELPSTSQQRFKQLERKNKLKVFGLRRLRKVGTAQRVESSRDTVMDDISKQGEIIANIDENEDVTLKNVVAVAKEVEVEKDAKIEENADVQRRQAESQAQIYQIDIEHVDKVLSMQDDELEPTKLKEVVDIVTTDKFMTEVVTAASDTITATTTPITVATLTAAPSAARRKKGVVIRDLEETAASSIIIHTEPKSKDKGKGIIVEEPKPLKKQAHIEQDEAYARELEATPLARKVPVVDYEIYTENNKPYYKIIRADGSPQLFLSFLSLLRNFDREDLEESKDPHLRTSKINAITYKTRLESVEARLLVYKKNESVYEDDIKLLKLENFENSSKSLSKLDTQIPDKCKASLGYNAVLPLYTRNFLPLKPNLSSLQDFENEPILSETTVKKPVVKTSKAKASADKPKVVKKDNGALLIKD